MLGCDIIIEKIEKWEGELCHLVMNSNIFSMD